jgi:hypothetical protein
MKRINISEYLEPHLRQSDARTEAGSSAKPSRPERDITYSVVLGYGFRPRIKEPPSDDEANPT